MSTTNPKKPVSRNPAAAAVAERKAPPVATPAPGPAAAPAPKPITPPMFRKIDWVVFGLTAVLTFIGYLYTLAPDLTLEDCGELAVGSFYAGVPHPPGYPVWTMYTWLFTQFLPISNIAYRVAISSAVAGALGCGFIGLMVSRGSSMMIEGIPGLKAIERRWEDALCVVSGLVAGMLLGFNGFMWSQAVIVEVYPLSVLSLSGVLVALMRWIYAPHQRRYLYLAFFCYGICFNNHQSLLVIALSLEVAISVVQPKLGRDLWFWNSLLCMGGLIGKENGQINVLQDNDPLLWHFIGIGVLSMIVWIYLVTKTRKDGWIDSGLGYILLGFCLFSMLFPSTSVKLRLGLFALPILVWIALLFLYKRLEMLRDLAMLVTLGYILGLFGHITNYVTYFRYAAGITTLRTGPFVLFNLIGLSSIALFIYLIRASWKSTQDWAAALACGGIWTLGALFYLFMPLASMSNPPMNWGYPRTVTGFFHAFTRGQYERIHPTLAQAWQGTIFHDGNWWGFARYFDEFRYTIISGTLDEFNFGFVILGIVIFLFYRQMQKRERAWVIALSAFYITLGPFLLDLLNPAPDKQSQDLNKVFFTASQMILAMFVGYGLTIFGAALATNYQRWRTWTLRVLCVVSCIGFIGVLAKFIQWFEDTANAAISFGEALGKIGKPIVWLFSIVPEHTQNPIIRTTYVFGLALGLAATAIIFLNKTRPRLGLLLLVGALMPVYSILSHWEDNEQRGHLFGYWFGHDMFTPPFNGADGKPIYPTMDRDTVLFGGTDPGRFNPTYMIFCESFIPPSKKPRDPEFDRRDVYLITQNALADGTYLNYIRAHYNRSTEIDPPFFTEFFRGDKEREQNYYTNIVARAFSHVDNFFLTLGDNIEKRRRAGTSFFKGDDFLDLRGLAAKLQKHEDAVSAFVYQQLSKETQGMLGGSGNESALRRALANDLNRFMDREVETYKTIAPKVDERAALEKELAGKESLPAMAEKKAKKEALDKEIATVSQAAPFYTPDRFKGVNLSDHASWYIKEDPLSHTRIRWSRLLLESAYPKEIAKSIGGVYPDTEIHTPSNEDSQRCFQEYLQDAQRRKTHDDTHPTEQRQIKPGEDVRIVDNRVQVSGQVAVMAINGLLTKIIFDKNPDHEFYVEESFPLDWMYPHLTPYGIIMKINRNPLPELTDDIIAKDHEFWSKFSDRLIGNWITYETPIKDICAFAEKRYRNHNYGDFKGDRKFIRDNDGQKAFSKLRSSIAGVYAWRIGASKTPTEQQRMVKEAEFAFKQAYAFCPYSPEAVFRYINLLISMQRFDDARIMAQTSLKLDPNNGQMHDLVRQLEQMKGGVPPQAQLPPPTVTMSAELPELEKKMAAEPQNLQLALRLVSGYLQAQQNQKALDLVDKMMSNSPADQNTLLFIANVCNQLNQLPRVEKALGLLVKLAPENPEAWFDFAGVQAINNKPPEALASLRTALQLSRTRLAQTTNAANLYTTAETDPRFTAIRQTPDFQKLMAEFKPAGK